jgi:hypothetical protein
MISRDLRPPLPGELHPFERFVIVPAVAFACMVVAALGGWGVARALRSPTGGAAGASRSIAIGPARLTVPPSWTPTSPASAGIPGLDSTSTRAFRIEDGLGQRAFVTLAAPADRWLIPVSLRRELRPPFGAPIPALLGGYAAWSYSNISTSRPNVVLEVTVLPTTAGVLAVACTSPSAVAPPSECDEDVEQLFVSGAQILRPTPNTAFRLAMSPIVTQLQTDRAAVEPKLIAARDGGAQAQALQAFGDAYTAAARRLDPLAPRSGGAATLVASLHGAAHAYRAAGTAASAGAFGDYFAARAAVEAAESKVATALGHVG